MKFTPKQRRFLNKQLAMRREIEEKLRKQVQRAFRGNTSNVLQAVANSRQDVVDTDFEENLSRVLYKHYMSTAKKFSSFSRASSKKNYFTKVNIEQKSWAGEKSITSGVEVSIDRRMRERLEEWFSQLARTKANQITYTTNIEINAYITKLREKALQSGVWIKSDELLKLVRSLYLSRIDPRSSIIATTETTSAVETTKRVEVEELLDELDEDELQELIDSGDPRYAGLIAELEDAVEEMQSEDGVGIEDIIAAGGLAALLAGATMTKTWVAVGDELTRDAHADADGQEVGMLESFNVGGEDLEYPGDDAGSPENTINCRCTVIYGTEDGGEE